MKHQKLETSPEISKRMAKVHLRGGQSEDILAKSLWQIGIKYRKNFKKLPGSPDIAITKYKIAIFIDGEFWHGYHWEERKEKLKSNKDYWIEKIEENIKRDNKNDKLLIEIGWQPMHFWEKEINKDLSSCIEKDIRTHSQQKMIIQLQLNQKLCLKPLVKIFRTEGFREHDKSKLVNDIKE